MDRQLSSKSDQPLRELRPIEQAKLSGSETVTKEEIDKAKALKAANTKCRKDNSSCGEFSDPVYKRLAKLNGEINRMTKEQLRNRLTELHLDTNGVKEVLKRRLKNFYKKQKLMKARIKSPGSTKYDYLVVIDFEATCERDVDDYQHEIIEFPAVLIDVAEMDIVDHFHSYCKPRLNPQLTEFCKELTGITQNCVDAAPDFSVVLSSFCEWMEQHQLGEGISYAIVTDGPWDMSRFLHMQCQHSELDFPRWARKWINIRKVYSNFYQCRRCGIESMLISLGMTFEGQLHCGLDDAKNIARIAVRLLHDGATFRVNEYLQWTSKNIKDRTCDVENVTKTNPVPADILSDDDLELGDFTKVNGRSGKSRRRNQNKMDKELVASMKELSVAEPEEEDDVEDLLAYYKLQRS